MNKTCILNFLNEFRELFDQYIHKRNVFMYVHSIEHRAVRLLSRRYDLTATGYEYLEIGINGPPSYVEIALGDHRGHELSLSLEMWKCLYEQQGIFTRCFETNTRTLL